MNRRLYIVISFRSFIWPKVVCEFQTLEFQLRNQINRDLIINLKSKISPINSDRRSIHMIKIESVIHTLSCFRIYILAMHSGKMQQRAEK